MSKSICILFCLLLLISFVYAESADIVKNNKEAFSLAEDNVRFIDANNILMFVTNCGILGRDLEDVFGCDAGTFYPFDGDTAHVNYRIPSSTPLRANAAEAVTYYANLIQTPLAAGDSDPALPETFTLRQNYPNPFNPKSTISYSLRKSASATLTNYNILGEEIARPVDGFITAGDHTCHWNGKDKNGAVVSSGIYLYKLTTDGVSRTRRMVLLK